VSAVAAIVERALAGLPRPRLSARASGFAGGLAIILGVALLADAVVTVAWREPITAVFAQHDQKVLERELSKVERAPLSASTLALVKEASSKEQLLATVAHDTRARTKPGNALGRLEIDRIDRRFVFVAGTGEKSLKKAPGHYAGTVLPGERGTVGIAGHRTTYLAPFRKLNKMKKGDRVTLTMPYGRFSYAVNSIQVVSPSHIQALRHTRQDKLVLTTCTPLHSAKRRIIVTARLKRSVVRGPIRQTPLLPVAPL
jgi:sortase A